MSRYERCPAAAAAAASAGVCALTMFQYMEPNFNIIANWLKAHYPKYCNNCIQETKRQSDLHPEPKYILPSSTIYVDRLALLNSSEKTASVWYGSEHDVKLNNTDKDVKAASTTTPLPTTLAKAKSPPARIPTRTVIYASRHRT